MKGGNKFKAIVMADMHMSNSLPMSQPVGDGVTDRLNDQMEVWKKVHQICIDRKATHLIFLGDLFDKSLLDAVTLTHTISALIELSKDVKVRILPGNHDASSIKGGRFTVEAFGAMDHENISVLVDEWGILHGRTSKHTLSTMIYSLPYMPMKKFQQAVAEIRGRSNPKNFNVLFMHQSIIGAEHLGWECDDGIDPDWVCEGFDLVMSGHFHDTQAFGEVGMYVGAPMHHSFSDVGRAAGVWSIELDGVSASKEFIPIDSPKFHKVVSDLDPNWDLVKPMDYCRLEVALTHAEWQMHRHAWHEKMVARLPGVHCDMQHKPIYHHKKRLRGASKVGVAMTVDESIAAYLSASEVITTGLDTKKLSEMAREVLGHVRSTRGIS